MKMTRIFAGLPVALMLASALPGRAADLGAQDEAIKFAILEWTGQHVTSHIAGQLLEKLGYKVEYVTAGNFPQFTALSDGTLSASVEIWLNNVGEVYPVALADKSIEDIGSLHLETREGWVYPKYMETVCPGLPDWSALTKPDCVAALASPETFPNGRILDYPADWGSRAATIVADNALPYVALSSGSEGALVSELVAADAAKTPLLMMLWSPHYILSQVEVGWVEMPPCKDQSNEHCINPPEVTKIVWSGFGEKWPAAYEVLKQITMDAKEQELMIFRVERGNEDIDVVVKEWIENHEGTWKPWLDAAKG